ncbi:serine/threonine protein phosphatase [Luteimonas vadosa]|uniref:Serine/threonine protein phosphatase n=1 Tax=Luteimonas vadosa TaxID=1165507 RepID=A0ABP9DYD6_9GAMM
MAVEAILVDGRRAWRKRYRDDPRRLSLAALDALARAFDLPPLRPPPRHPSATKRKQVEAGRLRALRASGVRVPEILAEDDDSLTLSDLGATLATRLRELAQEPAAVDTLSQAAIDAIADAHARGACIGQPVPRNLSTGDGGIGFFDLEEDPLETMTLPEAQARDWILFAYGIAKHYDARPGVLATLLAEPLQRAPAEVATLVRRVGRRLHPLGLLASLGSRSMRALAHAVDALR